MRPMKEMRFNATSGLSQDQAIFTESEDHSRKEWTESHQYVLRQQVDSVIPNEPVAEEIQKQAEVETPLSQRRMRRPRHIRSKAHEDGVPSNYL